MFEFGVWDINYQISEIVCEMGEVEQEVGDCIF